MLCTLKYKVFNKTAKNYACANTYDNSLISNYISSQAKMIHFNTIIKPIFLANARKNYTFSY